MLKPTIERLLCWSLLLATFAIRAIRPDQPIVENYVGRQIPTAMVARNLERGSGFLSPQLDTGPWPNLFLVEPPIYAQLVAWVHRGLGFVWESSGRLTSALATALGAWGLFGLARRREGPAVALLALGSFCFLPVMVRYGRAFQPDALMLGCILAGLRGWDEYEAGARPTWMIFGGFVLALGLAIKVTAVWAVIPFWLIARRLPTSARVGVALAMLAPALAWYLHAWGEISGSPAGSAASSDNASLWLGSFGPATWTRPAVLDPIARNLLWRAFTPVGFVLAMWGLAASGPLDRLWVGWGAGCMLSVLAMAPKWHHGYYWMAFAPPAAVGIGRFLGGWLRRDQARPAMVAGIGFVFAAMAGLQAAPTWRTPDEWRVLDDPGERVRLGWLGSESAFVAPEALLYYLDTRGYRLEFEPPAIRRAAGEWGGSIADPGRPMALVDYYEARQAIDRPRAPLDLIRSGLGPGPRVPSWTPLGVADVGFVRGDARRAGWREAIRARAGVRIAVDRPDLFVASLIPQPSPAEGRSGGISP